MLLTPIYEALTTLGGVVEREHIRFGEWPVRLLTDANELIAEAIREAADVTFDRVPTRLFRAEHLCAIALQTGRTKDVLRVVMFLEQRRVDPARLEVLARRFSLQSTLQKLPPAPWPGVVYED